jgi:Cu/Ag efflux pump CusA
MALMVLMPLFVGIVSVLQWMTLRYAVKQALLWVLANVVGGLIFSGMLWINAPRMDNDISWVAPFIAVLGQAFVTGIVMVWLFEKLAYPIQDVDDVEPLPKHTGPRSVWDEAI